MKTSRFYCLWILLLLCTRIHAQAPPLVKYDASNHLLSDMVYCIQQDAQTGFLWMSSAAGVSRFDGSSCRNFTAADGLEGSEILEIFPDSKGRVWCIGFGVPLMYIHNEKVYTCKNDALLAGTNGKGVQPGLVSDITEDAQGNIWLVGDTILCVSARSIRGYDINNMIPSRHSDRLYKRNIFVHEDKRSQPARIRLFNPVLGAIEVHDDKLTLCSNSADACFLPQEKIAGRASIMLYNTGPDLLLYTGPDIYLLEAQGTGCNYRVKKLLQMPFPVISIAQDAAGRFWMASHSGMYIYNRLPVGNAPPDLHLLPGVRMRGVFFDQEKNAWLITHDAGIYGMFYDQVLTIAQAAGREITAITGDGAGRIWAGTKGGDLFTADRQRRLQPLRYCAPGQSARITALAYTAGWLWCGTETLLHGIQWPGTALRTYNPAPSAIKALATDATGALYISCSHGLMKKNLQNEMSELVSGRTTTVSTAPDRVWVGRLDGLYYQRPGQALQPYQGPHAALVKTRISALAYTDSILWVGTWGKGLTGLHAAGYAIQVMVDSLQRKTDYICKSIFAGKDGAIWVATDVGLLQLAQPPARGKPCIARQYTTGNGLSSDEVHGVYVADDTVWVATAAGLSYFRQDAIAPNAAPRVSIGPVVVSGTTLMLRTDSLYRFAYTNNDFSISYAGIHFKSRGNILYEIKLDGYDTVAVFTKALQRTYASLAPGRYVFRVRARSAGGRWSEWQAFRFVIAGPWYASWWFITFMGLLLLALVFAIVEGIRQNERRKAAIKRQMAELRLEAVRAQMNPHFIYNCLNSIQYFLSENDRLSAQRYLSSFARLIRKTLDYSWRNSITLEEEIQYLEDYLVLEKLRFEHKFAYHIIVQDIANTQLIQLPPMLLQPYVENAIRHGLRNLSGRTGVVKVLFVCEGNQLICTIDDNGVGGLQPRARQDDNPHGMTITQERVESINSMRKEKISCRIIDKTQEGEAGTRIVLTIPLGAFL